MVSKQIIYIGPHIDDQTDIICAKNSCQLTNTKEMIKMNHLSCYIYKYGNKSTQKCMYWAIKYKQKKFVCYFSQNINCTVKNVIKYLNMIFDSRSYDLIQDIWKINFDIDIIQTLVWLTVRNCTCELYPCFNIFSNTTALEYFIQCSIATGYIDALKQIDAKIAKSYLESLIIDIFNEQYYWYIHNDSVAYLYNYFQHDAQSINILAKMLVRFVDNIYAIQFLESYEYKFTVTHTTYSAANKYSSDIFAYLFGKHPEKEKKHICELCYHEVLLTDNCKVFKIIYPYINVNKNIQDVVKKLPTTKNIVRYISTTENAHLLIEACFDEMSINTKRILINLIKVKYPFTSYHIYKAASCGLWDIVQFLISRGIKYNKKRLYKSAISVMDLRENVKF